MSVPEAIALHSFCVIFFLFSWWKWKQIRGDTYTTASRYQDIEIPRPKNGDIEIQGLKHQGIRKRRQIGHGIIIPRDFFRGQNSTILRFQDRKSTKSRFTDWKVMTLSFCRLLNLMLPDRYRIIVFSEPTISPKFQVFKILNISLEIPRILNSSREKPSISNFLIRNT